MCVDIDGSHIPWCFQRAILTISIGKADGLSFFKELWMEKDFFGISVKDRLEASMTHGPWHWPQSGNLWAVSCLFDLSCLPHPLTLLSPYRLTKLWPYADTRGLTIEKQTYNKKDSRAQVAVENVFGRLKGRWYCLMKRNNCDIDIVTSMVLTCCAHMKSMTSGM